jgi:hypothetical protein
MKRKSIIAVLVVLSSLLCSCATTTLVDTWRNPTLNVPRLKKVLVVSITKKDASRVVYEDIISSELTRRGVEALAGYRLMQGAPKSDYNTLQRAVQQSGADGVLTLQTIKVEQQTTIQPGYVTTYPGNWYPEAFPTWDLYGYYGSMANYGPTYISTYDIATLQVNLFDTASGKLLWAATVESSEPEKVISVGKDVARIVVESLIKEGLI